MSQASIWSWIFKAGRTSRAKALREESTQYEEEQGNHCSWNRVRMSQIFCIMRTFPFFFTSAFYSIVCMCHGLIKQSHTDGNLGDFWPLVIAMNNLIRWPFAPVQVTCRINSQKWNCWVIGECFCIFNKFCRTITKKEVILFLPHCQQYFDVLVVQQIFIEYLPGPTWVLRTENWNRNHNLSSRSILFFFVIFYDFSDCYSNSFFIDVLEGSCLTIFLPLRIGCKIICKYRHYKGIHI